MFTTLRKFVFLLLLPLATVAQNTQWVHTIESEGFNECLDLNTDNQGNIYITGQIEFLSKFDDGYLLESAGIHDIFLAKYDSSGNRLWARRAGARLGGEKGHSIAVDGMGNVYITGEIDDTSYFDTLRVIARPSNNTFVAKYDKDGNILWVKHFEADAMNTRGYAIDVDAQGNVYACGATQNNVYFNGNLLLTTHGDYDAFVYKLDSQGNLIWIKQIGGSDSDKAYGIAVSGNTVYVTGYYAGNIQFDGGVSLNGFGGTDFFIAKYDTSGNIQWAKRGGGTGYERGYDITINVNGNIVCTGEFGGIATFGSDVLHSNGNQDMFVVAYNSNGNELWALRGGGPEDDAGRNLCHDANGNLFVGGDFADIALFPPYQVSSNGFADVFLVSYDSTGTTCRFIKSFGGPYTDRGRGVGVDNNGGIYFSGEFDNNITFDGFHITGDTLYDIFLVKLGNGSGTVCNLNATASAQDVTCNQNCDGIAFVSSTGQAPLNYEWSSTPAQYTDTASGLCAGTYRVTITDANGCTTSASVSVNQPMPLEISNSAVLFATCNGCSDGSIDLSITGGTSPYSYQWNDGVTTQDRQGIPAGAYSVCIEDNNGCMICDTFVVSEPAACNMNANASGIDISCNQLCDGLAFVTSSGQSPFTYSWSTTPVQHSDTAMGLCAGSYTVTITDALGCTTSASVTLQEPLPLIVSQVNISDATCTGCSDGSIDLSITGGTSPYSYQWNDGNTSQNRTGIPAGSYSVCIEDNNGCQVCDSFQLSEPPTAIVDISFQLGIHLYPNPATEILNIDISSFSANELIELSLFNVTGELLRRYSIRQQNTNLNISDLAPGIYFAKIISEKSNNKIAVLPLLIDRN